MKRTLIILVLILSLVGCSNAGKMEDTQIDHQGSDTDMVKNVEIDYDNLKDFRIAKSYWYSDDNIILAFEKPGENALSKILSFSISTNKEKIMYEGPFRVAFTDSFVENAEQIGYQSAQTALFFDKDTQKFSSEYVIPDRKHHFIFSPDIKYLALREDSGLNVLDRDTNDKILLDNSGDNYISLNWADDNSKLVYIDNNYSNIVIIDIDSKTKRILQGDVDFKYPDNFFELLSCYFLPNNNDVLVNFGVSSLGILSKEKNYESTIIAEDREITVMDVKDSVILYATNKNPSNENKLVSYDYVSENKREVFSTSDFVICADISPDGNSVVVGTYNDGITNLYIVPIR